MKKTYYDWDAKIDWDEKKPTKIGMKKTTQIEM
jgi:hypothetical protein